MGISGNFKWKKLIKKVKEVKEKTLAKEKVKGLFEKTSPQEASGHNSEHPKQTYYCGSGLLMGYPLEKLFEWCILIGF